jgi:hypothetical protein
MSIPERRPRRTKRVLIRATVLAAVIGGSFAGIQLAHADAAGHGYGYVWADSPSATIGVAYTPSLTYQGNSSGAQNLVTHTATGRYTVRFPNLGALGSATVSAYAMASGNPDDRCKDVNWFADGAGGTLLNVACFTAAGVPVDSYFTASYTFVASSAGRGAYVWNDRPSSATGISFVPNRSYQFNSLGRTNTITRVGTGVYHVQLGGFGHIKGANWDISVTAYGVSGASPNAFCAGEGDLSTTTNAIYLIQCYAADGTLVNSSFALTYLESTNLLLAPPSTTGGYASVGCLGPSDCGLSTSVTFNSVAGSTSLDVLGDGQFAVHIPEDLGNGDVQLTQWFTDTPADGRCKIVYWNPFDGIRVNCYDNSGAFATSSAFALTFDAS